MIYLIVFFIYNEYDSGLRSHRTFAGQLMWRGKKFPSKDELQKAILEKHGTFAGITGITQLTELQYVAGDSWMN